jgi:hypothetical protein
LLHHHVNRFLLLLHLLLGMLLEIAQHFWVVLFRLSLIVLKFDLHVLRVLLVFRDSVVGLFLHLRKLVVQHSPSS